MTFGISHAQGELLGQVRPNVTTPVTLFQASQLKTEVSLILGSLIPTAAGPVTITLYHDDDGTTYTDDTVILTTSKSATNNLVFQAQHPGSGIIIKPGGSIGVQINSANDVNFSLYGITETRAERVRGASS